MNCLETAAYAVVIINVGAMVAESRPGVYSGQQVDRLQGYVALVASQHAKIG